MRTPELSILVAAVAVAISPAGCSCGENGLGNVDSGDDGDGSAGPCDPACVAPEVCRYASCVPNPDPCTSTEDCPGDTYCDTSASECLPWGVGPGGTSDDTCTREVVPGVFFPDVQCEWLGPPVDDPYPDHKNILGTPMVADFRAYGDPELGRPSIVFISYNGTDGGSASCIGDNDAVYYGVIRVIDGRSCEQLASIETPHVISSSSLALGDLTGDGIPEIIGAKVGGGVAAWKVNASGQFDPLWTSASTFGAGKCNWAGPSLHDLDDDGVPEIMLHGGVFDAAGNELDATLGTFDGISTSYIPIVADVDADDLPELIAGKGIYNWDRINTQWVLQQALSGIDSQTAVADFGTFGADPGADDRATLDGIAEVVMVNASVFAVYATTGRLIFNGPLPGVSPGNGGPPTIADFDGDGRVELATAGAINYTVFDPDCQGTPDAATCPSLRTDGILWSQPSKDASSNKTGSSVFDFEGDGSAEAVYGDECFLRVYEGATGEVIYSRFRTSCTWYENPVIADTDNDFGAEIIITSNTNCSVTCPAEDGIFDGVRCFDNSDCPAATTCGRDQPTDATGRCRCVNDVDCGGDGFICRDALDASTAGKVCRAGHPGPATAFGLRVVDDKLGRWVATRGIWNQHAYAVTNVEEPGRIPQTSSWARNWQVAGLNNFRQNSPGEGAGAGLMPDLTIKNGSFACDGTSADFSVEVCNRGTEPVADGVSVSVFNTGVAVCTAFTTQVLRPGMCQTVSCTVASATVTADYTIVVDDDGDGEGQHTECREGNNSLGVPDVVCP